MNCVASVADKTQAEGYLDMYQITESMSSDREDDRTNLKILESGNQHEVSSTIPQLEHNS